MTPFDRFVAFIVARENARVTGQYTGVYADILKTYRFCNVNREDDRVTKWIDANLRMEGDPKLLVMKLVLGRFINWPDSLVDIIGQGAFDGFWNGSAFMRAMACRMSQGEKTYTGAYMIRAGTGEDAKLHKHEYLVKRVFDPLWETLGQMDEVFELCDQWDELLRGIFGMGDFMRNQIITDMKYTYLLPRAQTADWETFCLAGPGTNRGLNRLEDLPLTQGRKSGAANDLLLALRSKVLDKLGTKSPAGRWWKNTFADLNNLSNCLCEFDKAERVRLGQGKPRSLYRPNKD